MKPKQGERVHAEGQPGLQTVVRVDPKKKSALLRHESGLEDWFPWDWLCTEVEMLAQPEIHGRDLVEARRAERRKRRKARHDSSTSSHEYLKEDPTVATKKKTTKKKTTKKAKAEKGGGGGGRGIQALLVAIFSRKTVPADEEIWRQVKKEFPDSKFKLRQIKWYKNRYVHGALSGQDGKTHKLNQPKVTDGSATEKMGLPRSANNVYAVAANGGERVSKAAGKKAPKAKAKKASTKKAKAKKASTKKAKAKKASTKKASTKKSRKAQPAPDPVHNTEAEPD